MQRGANRLSLQTIKIMKSEKRIITVVVAYNTDSSTKLLLECFPGNNLFDILIVNDGSTDTTQQVIDAYGFKAISHSSNRGVGAAIKTGIRYGLENGYYAIVILAGNNKDDPGEISRLLKPILEEDYDYVQGSRFLKCGRWDNLPLLRYVMIKIHAFLFYILTGFWCTDALNGFRAYKLSLFNDGRINIWESWLDRYELETYLHYKVIKCGYKIKEVPVSKIYPKDKKVKYSHIRPFIDWWVIMRPLLFLLARIKK